MKLVINQPFNRIRVPSVNNNEQVIYVAKVLYCLCFDSLIKIGEINPCENVRDRKPLGYSSRVAPFAMLDSSIGRRDSRSRDCLFNKSESNWRLNPDRKLVQEFVMINGIIKVLYVRPNTSHLGKLLLGKSSFQLADKCVRQLFPYAFREYLMEKLLKYA